MSETPITSGLYFNEEQIAYAQQNREEDADLQIAWDWLLAEPGTLVTEKKPHKKAKETIPVLKPELSALGTALVDGFCFRFIGDEAAGKRAVKALVENEAYGQQPETTLLDTLMHIAATLQLLALLKPILPDAEHFLERHANEIEVHFAEEGNASYVERCWLILLRIAGGILFGNESWLQMGVEQYKHIIDNDIHPEGFLRPTVERDKPDGGSLERMLLAVGALSLAAEAAYQAGTDLWSYQNRDVGLNTAVTYLVYYYFYPDKWRWDEGITREDTEVLYKQYGAFIEIAASHDYPRGVEILLETERPFFSEFTGGLTTLSHSRTRPKHRIRWLL